MPISHPRFCFSAEANVFEEPYFLQACVPIYHALLCSLVRLWVIFADVMTLGSNVCVPDMSWLP